MAEAAWERYGIANVTYFTPEYGPTQVLCFPEAGRAAYEAFKPSIGNISMSLLPLSPSNQCHEANPMHMPPNMRIQAVPTRIEDLQREALQAFDRGQVNQYLAVASVLLSGASDITQLALARRLSNRNGAKFTLEVRRTNINTTLF